MTPTLRRVVGEELTAYFLGADSDLGLASSWEPLAMAARGGFGGSPDPDRRAYRHRLGRGYSAIGQARIVRRALQKLSAADVEALWASFGPTAWSKLIDSAFGRGTAIRVAKRMGDLAGVALLTQAVREGAEKAQLDPEVPPRFKSAGGFVVAICYAASPGPAGKVKRQAEALLDAAMMTYAVERCLYRPQPQPVPMAEKSAPVPADFFQVAP